MAMNHRLLRPRARSGDSDVLNYIAAVEAADGQSLEQGVKDAIRDFIVGCKTDGIWAAIKASCILMGARTLSGALVPLAGTAPTNNNFVSGDYTRGGATPGLQGNGSNKWLNSQRNNNADPQNDKHISVYVSVAGFIDGTVYIGGRPSDISNAGATMMIRYNGDNDGAHMNFNALQTFAASATKFKGISRASGTEYQHRSDGVETISSTASEAPANRNLAVFALLQFATGIIAPTSSRIAFYSIGEAISLSSLESRVAALYNAIGSAIP